VGRLFARTHPAFSGFFISVQSNKKAAVTNFAEHFTWYHLRKSDSEYLLPEIKPRWNSQQWVIKDLSKTSNDEVLAIAKQASTLKLDADHYN
jgi:hypothetical protein